MGRFTKCAIYARVSTRDRQDNENQLAQLREFCRLHGWTIVKEYTDEETGRSAKRPAFAQLFADASRGRFQIVLFWALDRFSRQGVLDTLTYLRQLADAGVKFRSFTQPYLDTSGTFGDAIIAIIAAVAQQETILLSERTKAGLARARRAGRVLGRPAAQVDLPRFKKAIAASHSLKTLSRDFKVSVSTAQRMRKNLRATARNS